jgi:hypothetical protein
MLHPNSRGLFPKERDSPGVCLACKSVVTSARHTSFIVDPSESHRGVTHVLPTTGDASEMDLRNR